MSQFRFATAVNSSADPRVLQTIAMEGVALALWNRALSDELRDWLDTLPAEDLPQFDGRIGVHQVAIRIRAINAATTSPSGALLAEEIARLARIASEVLASPYLHLRLGASALRRAQDWQLDATTGRLRCTLKGPGIEYGTCARGGKPRSVHRMARGEVGLFRGALWPGSELAAILHRAAPQTGRDARLDLVISPVEDASVS